MILLTLSAALSIALAGYCAVLGVCAVVIDKLMRDRRLWS